MLSGEQILITWLLVLNFSSVALERVADLITVIILFAIKLHFVGHNEGEGEGEVENAIVHSWNE